MHILIVAGLHKMLYYRRMAASLIFFATKPASVYLDAPYESASCQNKTFTLLNNKNTLSHKMRFSTIAGELQLKLAVRFTEGWHFTRTRYSLRNVFTVRVAFENTK